MAFYNGPRLLPSPLPFAVASVLRYRVGKWIPGSPRYGFFLMPQKKLSISTSKRNFRQLIMFYNVTALVSL